MDWTFWVGAAVIVALLIVTQVFLHESRWSQRRRPDEHDEPDEPDEHDGQDQPGRTDRPPEA